MQMQMKNLLSALLTDMELELVTLESFVFSNLFCDVDKMTDDVSVFFLKSHDRVDMFFRNQKHMCWSFGLDIIKGDTKIIFIDKFRGNFFVDNFAK